MLIVVRRRVWSFTLSSPNGEDHATRDAGVNRNKTYPLEIDLGMIYRHTGGG